MTAPLPLHWGPFYWRFMHVATLLHGRSWSPQIVATLDSVLRNIPDQVSVNTVRTFLADNPLPLIQSDYLSPDYSQGPFEWVNRLHNFVRAHSSMSPKNPYSLLQSEMKAVDWLRLPDDVSYQQTPAYTPDSPTLPSDRAHPVIT